MSDGPLSRKPLEFIGSSRDDLRKFPKEVRIVIGTALNSAHGKHPAVKPLRGFGGAGVLEIVDDFDGDAYRAVYTVKFADMVYVLHAFQKKSHKAIETPRREIELIRRRYNLAQAAYNASRAGKGR